VPVGVGVGLAAGGWALVATRKAAGARRARIQVGAEALAGRVGVVRRWSDAAGQVYVDGALWRARRDWEDPEEEIHEGDPVLVERVGGLTLSVRKAYPWELTT
jgi:membrane-bound serine protease (ClpP class)